MKTDDLIIGSPAIRRGCSLWRVLAREPRSGRLGRSPISGIVALAMFQGMSAPGFVGSPLYVLQQVAALVTGITAARAALLSVVPLVAAPDGCCLRAAAACGLRC